MIGVGSQMLPIQNDPKTKPPRMYVVAFAPEDVSALPRHVCAPGTKVSLHTYDSLNTAELYGNEAPDYVISPLVAGTVDAQDIAWLLSQKGFGGRYLAITRAVAAPQVVRDDVARVAPDLNFDIVTLNGKGSLRAV